MWCVCTVRECMYICVPSVVLYTSYLNVIHAGGAHVHLSVNASVPIAVLTAYVLSHTQQVKSTVLWATRDPCDPVHLH